MQSLLLVPYFSQWGPGAGLAPGDCGPACICMAVHYLTDHSPTVDAVSVAAGMERGARWSSLTQLAAAARHFGLQVEHVRPLTRGLIERELEAGFPALALVKYDLLGTPDDPNQDRFTGAHFVLLVGHTARSVILHDPDRLRGDEFGAFRKTPWPVFINALMSTSKTPGNAFDGHGMTFDV